VHFKGSGLMQLPHDTHSRKEPTVMLITTHPTPLQRENVFHQALHRFHRLSSLLAQSAVLGPMQDCDHVLALLCMVTVFARCSRQGHPSLSLQPGKQVLYEARVLDAYTIGVQAYVYGWPIVEAARIRSNMLNPQFRHHPP
jgi:hypothetical protein